MIAMRYYRHVIPSEAGRPVRDFRFSISRDSLFHFVPFGMTEMSFHARTVDRREIPGNKNSHRHTAGVLKETDGKEHNLHFFPAVAISSIISSGGSGKSGKEARREDRTSPNSPPRI